MAWRLLLLCLLASSWAQEETCLSGEEEPYLMYGTRTAYPFVSRGTLSSKVHEVAGCAPHAFWLLNRHGSHNPELDEISPLMRLQDLKMNILENYKSGNFRNTNHRICPADLNTLERWQYNPRHNATYAGDLTSDGYLAMQQIAQAWMQRFPNLVGDNRKDYLFEYSKDRISETSFRAFTEGLFKAQAEGYGIPTEHDEKLLKPYESCPSWKKDVNENNETSSQQRIFESKQEYREMITNISKRLGFNYDIDKETVLSMYKMCAYNKAWDLVPISPWCSVFTKEDLKRLEYSQDLDAYYRYGIGTSANKMVGCTLLKDMMDFFARHIQNTATLQQPRVKIHLVEYPSILLLQSLLGAHRDSVPLTGDNYRTPQVQARKWTVSRMAPYNANIAAVLYRCNNNNTYPLQDQYQVLFLENEHQMYLEGCRVGLCDWYFVKRRYGTTVGECDSKYCNRAGKVTGMVFVVLVFSLVLLQ